MKKSISYQAVAGIGIQETIPYYWNGYEFITTCKVTFPAEAIADQYNKAKAALKGAVAMWPDSYNFGIK